MILREKGLTLLALAALGAAPSAVAHDAKAHGAVQDELQSWIGKNAVSVRSIDPVDENFEDLDFLTDVIGDAQVVQLGEASHRGGNGLAAKARLVRFLHQRMGFDVLVWEEGIYDMRLVQAGLTGSEDALTVVRRAIRKDWSNSQQIEPLFDYAKASLTGTHPLEMAGYDSRFSSQGFEKFASSLGSFVAALRDVNERKRSQQLVASALAAYDRICCAKDVPPGRAQDLENLHRTADVLLKEIDANRGSFERVHGARETSFMERSIESMRSDGTGKFYMAQATPGSADAGVYFSRFWHQRDEQGARNLRWLIEKAYPGRKIMFWAHNVHVMNAYTSPMFKEIHVEPRPGDMKPVGVYMGDWLGDKVYTIGLAHFEGEEGLAGERVTPVLPAPAGSLEARLKALGKPYLFLNLRAVDSNPAHPLHSPQSMRAFIPNNYTVSDVTKAFDGIFYIDRVTTTIPARGHE
jgi:erythromycin esterase